jgi:IclR family transcriptional regulator, pca regulon regulatory protein
MSDPTERRDFLQTLQRGLEVIVAFTGRSRALTLSELSRATGLSKPTVRRILITLEQLGYAASDDGRYRLTPRVLSLGYAYLASVRLSDVAQPLMEDLTDRLALGTSLAVLDDTEIVYVHRVQRHRITDVNLAVGTRLPAHATSMGHVLLAGLPDASLGRYLERARLVGITAATITDTAALTQRLATVRSAGWAVVDQELELGRRSVAVPVHDASGSVTAALSLSAGTSERTVDELVAEVVPPLLDTAREISVLLGAEPVDAA